MNMTDPHIAIPSRAPSATAADDTVMPFEVAALDLRGRVVRLGPVVDEILERHNYPQPVAKLLGEAVVLAVMLGSALKIQGRFILQTQTDGPGGLRGGGAGCCGSPCRTRRRGRASPICIPAMRRKASKFTPCRKTTPGWKAARWSPPSQTSS